MKKISVLYFDNERQKYRVAMGERQNIHIGRYDTLQEAQRVQMAIMKAYEEGEKAALQSDYVKTVHKRGFDKGYSAGLTDMEKQKDTEFEKMLVEQTKAFDVAYENGYKAGKIKAKRKNSLGIDNTHEAGYETGYTNGFDNGVRWGFSKGLDHAKDAVEQESMNVDVAVENDVVQECIEQAKTVGDYEGA